MSQQTITNQNPVMGFEGKIYVGPRGTTTLTNMILLEDVKDPTYTYKFDEVEVNTRRHGGNKVYAKGMRDIGISFTLPNIKPAGPAVALVLQALHNRRMPIAIAMLDEENGEGPFGDFEILGGDKAEDGSSMQELSVEAKPSVAGRKVGWYTPSNP